MGALEEKLTARLDDHESVIVDVLRGVMDLLDPPPPPPEPPKRQIGFQIEPSDRLENKSRKKA